MNTQEGICSVRCKTHTLTHFLCLQRSGKTGFLTSLTSCAWFLFTVAFQLLAVNSQECWSRHLRLTAWYILVQVPPRACQGCAIATGQLAAAKGFWPGPVSNQYCSILQFVPYIALVTWQMVIPTPFSSYPGTGISPLQPFNTLSFSFFIFLPCGFHLCTYQATNEYPSADCSVCIDQQTATLSSLRLRWVRVSSEAMVVAKGCATKPKPNTTQGSMMINASTTTTVESLYSLFLASGPLFLSKCPLGFF